MTFQNTPQVPYEPPSLAQGSLGHAPIGPQNIKSRRSYKGLFIASAALNAILLIVVAAVSAAHQPVGSSSKPQAASDHAANPAVSPPTDNVDTPTPAVALPNEIEFLIRGDAPDGIDITYGSDSNSLRGPSALDGTVKLKLPFDGSAQYYDISAQLQGAGDVSCKIVVLGPAPDVPLTVSSGHAAGGYNICNAQAAPEDSTGLNWSNES